LRKNVRFLLENGITSRKAVLMAVTAGGECPSMSIEERKAAIKVVADEAKGKVPLVTSAQDNNIFTMVDLSNYAKEQGYDAVMISQASYYGCSDHAMYSLLKFLSKRTDIGLMVYNTPWLSYGYSMNIGFIDKIVREIPNVVSIKWYSNDLVCYLEAYKKYSSKISFADNTINPIMAHMSGARMVMLIEGNFAPKYVIHIWDLMEEGEYAETLKELWKLHFPWSKWRDEMGAEGLMGEGVAVKPPVEMVGLPAGPARPPYDYELTPDQKSRLRKVLTDGGLRVVR
jgi:4-hydroxy-tetrahydrodipicolinate synthase